MAKAIAVCVFGWRLRRAIKHADGERYCSHQRLHDSGVRVYGSLESERRAIILACMKVKVRTTRGALLAARRSRALARRSCLVTDCKRRRWQLGGYRCSLRRERAAVPNQSVGAKGAKSRRKADHSLSPPRARLRGGGQASILTDLALRTRGVKTLLQTSALPLPSSAAPQTLVRT
jgi:hypothetical protein